MGDIHTDTTTSSIPAPSEPKGPDAITAALAALQALGLSPDAARAAVQAAEQAVKADLAGYIRGLPATSTIEEIACDERIAGLTLDALVDMRTGKGTAKRQRRDPDDPNRAATAGEVLQAAPQDGSTWTAAQLAEKIGRAVGGGVLASLLRTGKIEKAGSVETETGGWAGLYVRK